MSGRVNQPGAKSQIIQPYRPFPNQQETDSQGYRNIPNFDRPGDGHYTPDIYTSVLIRSDSTNNNTHFADFSHWRHPVNKSGPVKHDTAGGVVGPAATSMNFYNSSYLRFDDHEAFHAGTEWTLDFWFKGTSMYCGQHTASGNGNPRDTMFLTNNGEFGFYGYSTSGNWKSVSSGDTTSAWHHWAIVVIGSDIDNEWGTDSRNRRVLMFKDGKIISNQKWDVGGGFNSNSYYIGYFRESAGSASYATGLLDEFRFSVGIARWKNDFKVYTDNT